MAYDLLVIIENYNLDQYFIEIDKLLPTNEIKKSLGFFLDERKILTLLYNTKNTNEINFILNKLELENSLALSRTVFK